jgi:hypothetical protein
MLLLASLLLASTPFTGTLTYEVVNRGAPSERVIAVGATTLFVREGERAYFVDEKGARVTRDPLGALIEQRLMRRDAKATTTALADRTVAGRKARCLRARPAPDTFLTTAEEAIDHIDFCVLPDERHFSFADLDLGRVDADALFAAVGIRGLPALISLQTKNGTVEQSVTLKKVVAGPVNPTLASSLPAPDPKAVCATAHRTAVLDVLVPVVIAEQAWFAEHGSYASDLASLGFVDNAKLPARLRIVSADAQHFVGEAAGVGSHEGEVWRVDETGKKTSVSAAPCP